MKSEISNIKFDKDKELDYHMRVFKLYRQLVKYSARDLNRYLERDFGVVLKTGKSNKQLVIANIFVAMSEKGRQIRDNSLETKIAQTLSTKEIPNA